MLASTDDCGVVNVEALVVFGWRLRGVTGEARNVGATPPPKPGRVGVVGVTAAAAEPAFGCWVEASHPSTFAELAVTEPRIVVPGARDAFAFSTAVRGPPAMAAAAAGASSERARNLPYGVFRSAASAVITPGYG
jgi:hypothetical protein